MASAQAYQERWPEASVDLETVLGNAGDDNDEEVLCKLRALLVAILPAHMEGCEAAGRDWVKICQLRSDVRKKAEAASGLAAQMPGVAAAERPPLCRLAVETAPSGTARFNGERGVPYSFARGRVPHDVLLWLQQDPTLPKSRSELEQRYNYDKASPGAKREDLNNETRVQVMGQTVGHPLGRCNGLDATQLMPDRLVAWTWAFKKINAAAFDDLHRRLQSQLADEDLKKDGETLRDNHPNEWLFNFGMLQVMQPGRREDWKHIDGGASLLHLGLGLFGHRVVKHWEGKGLGTPHEVHEAPGSVYVSMPAVFWHQVEHRDAAKDENLMDFAEMGPCKVAVQLRCDLFPHDRGRNKMPKIGDAPAKAVVQPWLSQSTLLLPDLTDCKAELAAVEALSPPARLSVKRKRKHAMASTVPASDRSGARLKEPKRAATSGDASPTNASEDNVTASSTTASSAAEPAQTEAAPLKVLDTVKILTGPCAGEEGIVSEVKGDKSEVDEIWYSRSELEKLF